MKLLGYMPDADPLTDGALLECNHVIPTYRGIGSAPTESSQDVSALAATCLGAASLTLLNGDTRTFAGTATKLYEQATTAWADVSAGGGSYTTVTGRWRYAQYGNVSLAVNKQNVLQASNGSGAFAAVSSTASGSTVTAPAAAVIEVVNDFVFLADTTGAAGGGDVPDGWIASALGDYTDWTPDIATQCVAGRVTSVPGRIVAARKFGDQLVLYKERGMFLGSFVGPPVIWQFPEIPAAMTGTFCQESVASLGTPEQPLHFFVGRDDFYLFDGARPVPVGAGVKEQFFSELNLEEADQIICQVERDNTLVRVYYPSGGSARLNACLVFNYRTRKWGRDDRSAQFAFEYLAPGLTYDSLGGTYATYDALPDAPYDEVFRGATTSRSAIFSSGSQLQTLVGAPGQATLTPSHYGDDRFNTLVSRLTPRWIQRPSSASLTNYAWMVSGDTPSIDTTIAMESGRFDVLRSAAWHRFDFTFYGYWEVNVMSIDGSEDGLE